MELVNSCDVMIATNYTTVILESYLLEKTSNLFTYYRL